MKPNKTDSILSFRDLKWIFSAIFKYWYLFLIFIVVASVFGTIYNHKQISKYHTKIEILLKSNDVYDYQENLYSNLGFYNYYGDVANQIRIISSYDIIHPSWLAMPEEKQIKYATQNTKCPNEAFQLLALYMLCPIINRLGKRSPFESLSLLKEYDFDLHEVLYHLQGEAIVDAFHRKYCIIADVYEVVEIYKSLRTEGWGRIQVCMDIHLHSLGENMYETGKSAEWEEFDDKSIMDIVHDAPTLLEQTDVPRFVKFGCCFNQSK